MIKFISKKNLINLILISALVLLAVFLSVRLVWGWTNPTANPPGGGGALYYYNGNVGIGTTAPDRNLVLDGGTHTYLKIGANQPNNYDKMLLYRDSGGERWAVGMGTNFGYDGGFVADYQINYNNAGTWGNRFIIKESGNVGIGTTSPAARLSIGGSSNPSGNNVQLLVSTAVASTDSIALQHTYGVGVGSFSGFFNGTTNIGSITDSGGTGVAYNTSSDRRVKENIATTTSGLTTLMQIPVRDFDFIADPLHAKVQGFIAQELYRFYPYAVTTNGDNGIIQLGVSSTPWSVDYGRITPLLVQSIKDLNEKFEARTNFISNAASSTVLTVDAAGNVGIGTTGPAYKLDVNGTLRAYGITDSSDVRLKKDILPIDNALEKVTKLNGVIYKWIDEKKGTKPQMGLIAQEVENIFPEVVDTDDKGYKSIQYGKLVGALIEAIKVQQKQSEELKTEAKELKAENSEFKEEIKALKIQVQELKN